MPVSSPTPPVSLVCLCAAWCRLCDDYRPLFERVAAELRATVPQVEARWIDIETFPTLVIAGPEGVRFAGPLLPREDTLRRLVAHAITDVAPDAAWPRAAPEFSAFAARLRAAT